MTVTILGIVTLVALAFFQNVAFSLVSRSRNRSSVAYHVVASILSNAVWFVTFRHLVTHDMTWALLVPYTVGTVSGSVWGVKVSMWIEKRLGATSDAHIEKPKFVTAEQLNAAVEKVRKDTVDAIRATFRAS